MSLVYKSQFINGFLSVWCARSNPEVRTGAVWVFPKAEISQGMIARKDVALTDLILYPAYRVFPPVEIMHARYN